MNTLSHSSNPASTLEAGLLCPACVALSKRMSAKVYATKIKQRSQSIGSALITHFCGRLDAVPGEALHPALIADEVGNDRDLQIFPLVGLVRRPQ